MLVFPRKVSQQITTLKNIPSRRRKCQCSQPTRPTLRPSSHSRPSHPVDKGKKWHRMDAGIGIGPKHVKLHQTPVKCDKIMTYHSNSRLADQLWHNYDQSQPDWNENVGWFPNANYHLWRLRTQEQVSQFGKQHWLDVFMKFHDRKWSARARAK